MLYTRPSFTCPTASQKVSQMQWDSIFMNSEEFQAKYDMTQSQFAASEAVVASQADTQN